MKELSLSQRNRRRQRMYNNAKLRGQKHNQTHKQIIENAKDFGGWKKINGEKYPIFLCQEVWGTHIRLWKFYCPFCKKKHTHGKGEGLRGAHCEKKSPMFMQDYYIKLKGDNKKC